MFKKDICGTLEGYSSRISALKSEIDELGESAGCIEKVYPVSEFGNRLVGIGTYQHARNHATEQSEVRIVS